MDGLYNYKVQEPLFREYLQELDDEELSREARNPVFLCETSLGGPWEIDVFKTDVRISAARMGFFNELLDSRISCLASSRFRFLFLDRGAQ